MVEIENIQTPVPGLAVKFRTGTVWFDLEANGSLLIGSGSHCKIQLEGDGVKSLHCIAALKDGVVELRDWNTGNTLVNGVAITDPVELQNGDQIRICGHEIEAVLPVTAGNFAGTPDTESQPLAQSVPVETMETETMADPEPVPNQLAAQAENKSGQIVVEFAQPIVSVIETEETAASVESNFVPEVEQLATTTQPVEDVETGLPQVDDAPAQIEMEMVPQVESTSTVEATIESELEPQVDFASDAPADSETLVYNNLQPAPQSIDQEQPEVETIPEVTQPVEPVATETLAAAQTMQQELPLSDMVEATSHASADDQAAEASAEQTASTPADSQEFVYDILASLNDKTDQGQFDLNAPGFTLSDVEKLRADNERLKSELEQKEAALAATPCPQQDSTPEEDAEVLSREQTLSMISRMQELVAALKSADERNRELEEQLNSANAEPVESSPPPGGSVPIELVTQLRDQVQALQSQLKSTLAEVNSLREQASSSTESSDATADLETAKNQLTEMQLEVSREREEISRQKAELISLKTALQARLQETE